MIKCSYHENAIYPFFGIENKTPVFRFFGPDKIKLIFAGTRNPGIFRSDGFDIPPLLIDLPMLSSMISGVFNFYRLFLSTILSSSRYMFLHPQTMPIVFQSLKKLTSPSVIECFHVFHSLIFRISLQKNILQRFQSFQVFTCNLRM